MKKSVIIGSLLFLMLLGTKLGAEVKCSDPVSTVSGQLRGVTEENGTCAWKGIPFVAAPVGDLRWKAPQPEPAWSGVRDADKFGHRCMVGGFMALESLEGKEGMSEDCLYMNIWRPNPAGRGADKFPVMVWIHGGGYTGGSAITPMYWGDRLAQEGDVVVVSFNYRLNVFGFYATPALREEDPDHSVGSYGMLDQVFALKWVHDNIKNFGGDPSNVTIFGESAGGFSICTMIATPLAKGLFQRAILESGGCTFTEDLDKGYAVGKKLAENLGCKSDDLKCLRKVPAKTVLNKMEGGMGGQGNMPHIEGYALTDTPLAMIRAGNYNKVPFMAGSNREEFGNALKLQNKLREIRPKDYESGLVKNFKFSEQEAKELVALYPLSEFHNRPVDAYGHMLGADASLACPTYQGLLDAAKQQSGTYYYRFDYDDMKLGKYLGAAHSLEIPFIFDALDRPPYGFLFKKVMGPAKALSKIIQGYWLNFAKTGNPNGQGLPDWPMFTPGNQMVQILDSQVHAEKSTIVPRCQFWDTHKVSRPK